MKVMSGPASITIARNQRGDDEAHLSGCQHLSRKGLRPLVRHMDESLRGAIIAADTDMADNFGQAVYEPDPSDVPWTVAIMAAPCLIKAVQAEGLRFDPVTGEPKAVRS